MARDLTLSLRLLGRSEGLDRALARSQRGIQRFGAVARREFDAIRRAASSLAGKLAGLGAGLTLGKMIADSAHLTRNLAQTQRTAKMTTAELAAMRAEFFKIGRKTSIGPEGLVAAAQTLAAAGLSKEDIRGALPAVATAAAAAKANVDVLGQALTVASAKYNFNLSNPKEAVKVLDQMAKAGDLGSAELNKLADIFAKVGHWAKAAGLGFEQTLAFVEAMSTQEKQPERLGTLVESTLRLWNDAAYMEEASAATGVKFLDKFKNLRPMAAVLKDFRTQFEKIKTQGEKIKWFKDAFGKMEENTRAGMQIFLGTPGLIEDFERFTTEIKATSGFLEQGLPGAINNAIDQAERLKIVLREAAESFTLPIEKTFNRAVQWALDEQQLSGGEIAGGAAAGAAGLYALSRLGKGIAGRLAGKGLGLAGGVAAGAALEAAAGVTPVFVTNWPAGGLGGALGAGASAAGGTAAGGAAAGGAAAGVAAKGLLGAAGLAGAAAAMMLYPQKLGNAEAMTQGPLGWGKEALYPGLRLLEETSDQGVAMIDQHAGQAQQQIQTLGDQSASVIQQQGQAAQSGIQAATAEFNAAAYPGLKILPEGAAPKLAITTGGSIESLIQGAGNNVIGVLEQTGTAQAQQIQMVGDQGVALIDTHAGQAQQQLQALGDQSASVIQQQGQAAQSGIQAATAEFNAAASHLAAVLSRPQQVNVTVGLNSTMLNAYVDRRNQLEDRRYGAVTEGGF